MATSLGLPILTYKSALTKKRKTVKLKIYAASNVGKVRENNEDMVLVSRCFVRNDERTDEVDLGNRERYLVALADGMGGHNCGEVASSDVLLNLDYFFNDMPADLSVVDFNEAIYEWLDSINNIIESKGRVDERYYGMGTTLVAFAYYGGEFYWMNCGDSRIYRQRDGQLQQLSTDHSLSTLMGSTEHTNVITNCIGGGCKTSYIDIVTCTSDVSIGDTFMLCSDGLTDMLSDEQIQQLLNEGADATTLCAAAVEAGGYDNVSVSIIKIV